MFTVLDETNTVKIAMNNPFTGHSREVITLNDHKSIAWAIVIFAKDEGISFANVETSIEYPMERIK